MQFVADPLIEHVSPIVPFPVVPPPVLPTQTTNVQLWSEPGAVATVTERLCSAPAQFTVCWPFVFTWFIADLRRDERPERGDRVGRLPHRCCRR